MSTTIEAPQQYQRSSRKGKKAWRKNVDVTAIQDGLEIVRQEEVKGGVVQERPADALFAVDLAGSAAIRKVYTRVHKPLKADQILAQRSAIPAVGTHRRGTTHDSASLEPAAKRARTGVSGATYARLHQRAHGGESVAKVVVSVPEHAEHDPWAEVEATPDPRFSFLDAPQPVREPATLKTAPVSLLSSHRQVPAVMRPKPGISYNPEYDSWNTLLTAEGDKEVAAERQRLDDARAEAERQARIEAAQLEVENELGQTEDDSAWEGIESEYEDGEAAAPASKPTRRKTQAERNRIQRRKDAERLAKHQAKIKARQDSISSAKALARALDARAAAVTEASMAVDSTSDSDADVDDTALRRRRFGKVRLPPKNLELVLPDELEDSLRRLRPEGNLLRDRFRSLMVRGRIEARKPIVQPRKPRRYATEKWSYKDFVI